MAAPVPASDTADPFADRRVYPRVAVALPAFLQAGGKRQSVQLLDLSAGGAKLHGAVGLPVGTAVTLDCGTFVRTAVIRWQNGPVLGVSFDVELTEQVVIALAERSKALTSWRETHR